MSLQNNIPILPNNVEISTVNSTSSDTVGVAVFSPERLSWSMYSSASNALTEKFGDWSLEQFVIFFNDPANSASFEDA